MRLIPVSAEPLQTLAVTVGGQPCEIALRQNGDNMYFDLRVNREPVVLCRIVRNKQRLLLDAKYQGFIGDFLFWDTQGDTQPTFRELGTRYLLYYLEPADLP